MEWKKMENVLLPSSCSFLGKLNKGHWWDLELVQPLEVTTGLAANTFLASLLVKTNISAVTGALEAKIKALPCPSATLGASTSPKEEHLKVLSWNPNMDRSGTFSQEQLPKGQVFLPKDKINPFFFSWLAQGATVSAWITGPLSESDLELYPIVIPSSQTVHEVRGSLIWEGSREWNKGNISPLAVRPDFSYVWKALQVFPWGWNVLLPAAFQSGNMEYSTTFCTGLIFSGLKRETLRAEFNWPWEAKWQHFIFGPILCLNLDLNPHHL